MNKFRTVATFSYPAEAAVIKSKLESENIEVFLRDEFTIASDPFATNAIGSVKMDVYIEDFIKALAIIEKSSPELSQRITDYIICPNCKKRKVREQQDINSASGFIEVIKAITYSLLPLRKHKLYKCTNCAFEFDLHE
ncbi:putative signal transducing protein [Nonlabens agnitus]|uniref:Uncharacterized protein n=1 Tax=Nonlabens agnitus TaxID=870484 RepID=A0A2S9WW05_9FLAO|nr:DUF2007 domain-containing protein [Nonlabens agnitus]PRP67645.1 hypothetical protein BST86_11370 [Nonlabens agnitus]